MSPGWQSCLRPYPGMEFGAKLCCLRCTWQVARSKGMEEHIEDLKQQLAKALKVVLLPRLPVAAPSLCDFAATGCERGEERKDRD